MNKKEFTDLVYYFVNEHRVVDFISKPFNVRFIMTNTDPKMSIKDAIRFSTMDEASAFIEELKNHLLNL